MTYANYADFLHVVQRNLKYANLSKCLDVAERNLTVGMHAMGERPSKCAAIIIDKRQNELHVSEV